MAPYMEILIFASVCSVLLCISTGIDPSDNFFIDCGSTVNTSVANRVFVADSDAAGLLSTSGDILASTSSNSADLPLYRTARVFRGTATYTFPAKERGKRFIRLHFNPFIFDGYNMSASRFSVSTDNFVLIKAIPTIPMNSTVLIKEFVINVDSDSFIVRLEPLGNSFAYLNALEIVSISREVFTGVARTVSPAGSFDGLNDACMETVVRLNIGGPLVTPLNDTLWRSWLPDSPFIRNPPSHVSNIGAVNYVDGGPTRMVAPVTVYGTAAVMNPNKTADININLTWEIDVEAGFQYFVRYHFCDIVSTSLNDLYFNAYLGVWAAGSVIDLSSESDGTLAAPYYLDVVTPPASENSMKLKVGKSDIGYPNAILNGLEVMKLVSGGVPNSKSKNGGVIAGIISASVIVVAAAAAVAVLVIRRRLKGLGAPTEPRFKPWIPLGFSNAFSTVSTTATAGSNYGYRFPFVAVQESTGGFDENRVIGIGGFGRVYEGVLTDGTRVAVKRGNPRSQQGLSEFRTEIEMLSQFRHRHLVSLIGYCDEKNEMILIYEYMENGTLKGHLYGSDLPCLTWKQRLEACIGAARGLHYLHTGYATAVIHRDVKSANILLDENFMAKVADFGLSKTGPELDQTHVSTAVKGSFGYLDPEYFRRQQLTEKSDVYSFGVVLFEVVCARPVIDPSLPRETSNLAEWAMKWQKKRQLDQIMDPSLSGSVRPESLHKFGETAEKCLAEFGVDRPSMGDVLWNLEYALQLQEAAAARTDSDEEDSTNRIGELSPQVNNFSYADSARSAGLADSVISDLSGVSMSRVFSQLVKSEGR